METRVVRFQTRERRAFAQDRLAMTEREFERTLQIEWTGVSRARRRGEQSGGENTTDERQGTQK